VFEIRKNYHSSGRNLLLYVFLKRAIKLTVVIIEEYHLPATYKVLFSILSM
jgi:hypothetical protein